MELKIKYSLSPQEMLDFVNAVIDLSSVDGVYFPALFSYAFRVVAIRYFCPDYEFEKDEDGLIIQDSACQVAFEEEIYQQIEMRVRQLKDLLEACKEQIKINHDIVLAALRPADQMERLVDMLSDLLGNASATAKTLNPETIGKLVERLGSIDDKAIIDVVADRQEALTDKPKSKRGRKPGSKNKSKDDKIIPIPGQMSADEIVTKID